MTPERPDDDRRLPADEPADSDPPTDETDVDGPDADVDGPDGATATKPPGRRRLSRLLAVAAVGVYAAIGVTAGLTIPAAFLAVLVASQGVDHLVTKDTYVRYRLGRGEFGLVTRSLVRELATFAFVLGEPWAAQGTREAAALCVLGTSVLRMIYPLALGPVRRRRAAIPVDVRNIDLTGLRFPPVTPRILVTRIYGRSHAITFVGLVSAAVGVLLESSPVLFAVIGLVLLFELVALSAVVRLILVGRRSSSPPQLLAAVQERINALQPQVMLYHTGNPDSIYQANMWLSTIEALPRSSLVVVRERASLRLLAPTTTPVLYIPQSVDFMSFGLRDVRVTLYTANAAKNIHMLRQPGVRHVFIGHGDSDKSASSNPFSKVYSEIWVAGPAGRERYHRANTGVNDDDIVEVGRPQLVGIDTCTGPVGDRRLTVLYAPTWEGWTKDPAQAQTSLIRTGPPLVERLLARGDVRLVFKPHPLTGRVSKAAAAANEHIRTSIEQAGGDHQVVTGAEPTLYECFNLADVLIGDVSSVLSDFIASSKPYVVPNLTALSEEEFHATYPSTSGGYLLDTGARTIDGILDLIRGSDPMAARRRELKHYLLGPDEPDALSRFIAAVDAAYERAIAGAAARPASNAPSG